MSTGWGNFSPARAVTCRVEGIQKPAEKHYIPTQKLLNKLKQVPGRKPETIDEYIDSYDQDIAAMLRQVRKAIREAAPAATEVISYGMPAFKQNRVLVYFAANKNHLGFYPTAEPIRVFKNELKDYVTSKGAIHFPLDKALPVSLIKKIVKFRAAADRAEPN